MPFYRFEDLESNFLTPHLSTGKAPVIEGDYLYFCLIHKIAGTGSELHYHPNELLVFQVAGKSNTVVGRDRRIIGPGTFVHVPAYARHSIKATEDGNCQYLYIKDKTWTVVGLAEQEAVPDRAMTVAEVNRKYTAGELKERTLDAERSQVVVDGLHDCYYPLLASFTQPRCSAERTCTLRGERLAFGFCEVPQGEHAPAPGSGRELFVYLLAGEIDCRLDGEERRLAAGDVVHAPRGAACRLTVVSAFARYVTVCPTAFLEQRIDTMSPEEREQVRIHGSAP
ncbi:MAG: cupin domain-containing protein [Syntrophales bacterium]